jgi:hypothetical protein
VTECQCATFSVMIGEGRTTERGQKATTAKFEAFVWFVPGGAEENTAICHSALLAFLSKFELGSIRILSCGAALSTATFRHLT